MMPTMIAEAGFPLYGERDQTYVDGHGSEDLQSHVSLRRPVLHEGRPNKSKIFVADSIRSKVHESERQPLQTGLST